MKYLLPLITILLTTNVFGQKKQPKFYVSVSGDTVRAGDKVKIGFGTKPDGTFKFFDGFITPGAHYTGMTMIVKSIIIRGNKNSGLVYFLKLYPGVGAVNYEAQIENALKVGEIELIKVK